MRSRMGKMTMLFPSAKSRRSSNHHYLNSSEVYREPTNARHSNNFASFIYKYHVHNAE